MLNHGARIVTDGLVLCLDAANPKSYPGTGTTWYDLSGNGNNATQNGDSQYVNYNTDGYFELIPSADWETGVYWSVPSDNSLNFTNAWSLCGFLNIQGSQSSNGASWLTSSTSDLILQVEPITTTFRTPDSNNWSELQPSVSAFHNKFTYYAFTFEQTTIKMYVNGNLYASSSNYVPNGTSSYGLWLARRRGHLAHFLKAQISNYYFYTRSLSDNEIQQNFQALRGRYGI